MSKKMIKRSLALGALMAFVITGNALAAEVTVTDSSFTGVDTTVWATNTALYNKNSLTGNTINVNGDFELTAKTIYGAFSIQRDLSAEGNRVNLTDVKVTESVFGANLGGNSTIENNIITIAGKSKVSGVVYAAWTFDDLNSSATVKNNKVYIKDNATVNDVYGAWVQRGSEAENVVVTENEINISGKANITGKNIYGAYVGSKIIDNNNVSDNSKAIIKNNTVNISGDVVIGNDTSVYGSYAKSFVSGGTVTGSNITVENNTVNISGNAKVLGTVYGGYAKAEGSTDEGIVEAGNNTINLSENADISGAVLVGSETELVTKPEKQETGNYQECTQEQFDSATGTKFELEDKYYIWVAGVITPEEKDDTSAQNTSNNTLNISKDWTGGESGNKEVKSLGNFDEIVIEEMQYGETALTVTEEFNYKANEENNPNSNGTKITVKRMNMSGDTSLEDISGLKIIDIGDNCDSNLNDENSENGKGAISDESSITIYKGTSEIIEVGFGGDNFNENTGIQIDESNVTKSIRNDQVLVIGESRAAATAFVNQGSEIIETGLDALARDNTKVGDTKVFAAVYGNASEYATGSHVKVNGWSGIVGVGKTNANGLTVGAFFENGEGNYHTYNTVNNEFMRGDGEANYNGGGFLIRKDNPNGVYTEASLRAGNLQNELRKAVRDSEGLAGYDVDTFYYGAHVGVGKIIPRGNEGDSIDVYGKFIYTHHDSESFDIDGSDFHFDSVDSERLRLGFRINEVQTNKLSMYYGAAWEYEFGGDADNTTVGYDLSTPSLGGSTVIGEIGMHYLASEKWSLDINVRGYSGQRDGFTGSVQANYAF